MDDAQVMGYLASVIQEGKVDIVAESIALLHAFGKPIEEKSVWQLHKLSAGTDPGEEMKLVIKTAIEIYKSLPEINPYFEELMLKQPKKGYVNPLMKKAPAYTSETMKTAVVQYDLMLAFANMVMMFRMFKQVAKELQTAMGGKGKETVKQAPAESLKWMNKFAARETFDPYLHAGLFWYAMNGKVKTPVGAKLICELLKDLGVKKPDAKRAGKAFELINKSEIPEMVKKQMADLEKILKPQTEKN